MQGTQQTPAPQRSTRYRDSTLYSPRLPAFTTTAHRLSRPQTCQHHAHSHGTALLDRFWDCTVLQTRTGERYCCPWFTWICRPRAVWYSTNHSACRYLQLRGRFASITDDERPLRSAISLYTTPSQKPSKPLRPWIALYEHGGRAGEQT